MPSERTETVEETGETTGASERETGASRGVHWGRILRATLRYTVVYAAVTVGGVYWATESKLAMILTVALGLLALLGGLKGTIAGTKKQTAVFTDQSDGPTTPASELPSSVKPLFYGAGVLVFSAVVLVAL
jgi:hypothetical protein